jgi:molybdate transport system substrate-binding protein
MKLRHIPVVLAALALVPLAACSGGDDSGGKTITVYAGTGVSPAMEDLVVAFNEENQDYDAEIVVGSNAELIDKVRGGDEVDVFAATKSGVGPLVKEEKLMANPVELGTDPILIAVPLGNPKGVNSLNVFGDDENVVSGLCPESAPCGSSARRVLTDAGVTPAPDVVSTDAGDLLDKVVNAEVDAAMLFRTQIATKAGKVSVVVVPGDAGVENTYQLGRVEANAKTLAFIEWVQNAPTAKQILRERGLLAAEGQGGGTQAAS